MKKTVKYDVRAESDPQCDRIEIEHRFEDDRIVFVVLGQDEKVRRFFFSVDQVIDIRDALEDILA